MNAVGDLLESEDWAGVLHEGFGCTRLETSGGMMWTVFRTLGVSVAYLRFPVGLEGPDAPQEAEIARGLDELRSRRIDLARFSTTDALDWRTPLAGPPVALVETAIDPLHPWTEDRLAHGIRRKLRKARTAGLAVRDATGSDGAIAFDFYSETIQHRKGARRYNRRYFEALCGLAERDGRLSVGIVEDAGRAPCGFIVVAHSKSSSHYLHGGFARHAGEHRPGYLAMAWAISLGVEFASLRFNMLVSPRDQPSLVAFKESFGGRSCMRWHYDVPLTSTGKLVSRALLLSRDISTRLGRVRR